MRCVWLLLGVMSLFAEHPFDYDLHLTVVPGNGKRTMICFHGYGADYEIIHYVKSVSDATLVSFNFPETRGTIEELLPAFYVLKKIVIEGRLDAIDLYGFSAGGAAAVNIIGVLNSEDYDAQLAEIGIGAEEKAYLLSAIQRGRVILDAPLKSWEEVIDFLGASEEFKEMAENYRQNGFRPLDSLEKLKGLALYVVVYFERGDEILSNRDDQLFIKQLKKANEKGIVNVIRGKFGGHMAPHLSLWKALK